MIYDEAKTLTLVNKERDENFFDFSRLCFNPEEVRHGDVTAGVKRAWNVITADKYSFFHS